MLIPHTYPIPYLCVCGSRPRSLHVLNDNTANNTARHAGHGYHASFAYISLLTPSVRLMMQSSNAVVTSLDEVRSGWVYSFELADQSVGCSGDSGRLAACRWMRCPCTAAVMLLVSVVCGDEWLPCQQWRWPCQQWRWPCQQWRWPCQQWRWPCQDDSLFCSCLNRGYNPCRLSGILQ